MFHKPETFSAPRPPTEREKSIIHGKMLEEIEKMTDILKNCEIDAEYVRESKRPFLVCAQMVTRATTSIFMAYDENLEFQDAFREDPVERNPGAYFPSEWEEVTTIEKSKAIQDKLKAEERLKKTFDLFEPHKVRKVYKGTPEEKIRYILKVIIWHIFPIICMPLPSPYRPDVSSKKEKGIILKSLSLKNPLPLDEEEELSMDRWTPERLADKQEQGFFEERKRAWTFPRTADQETQKMINEFKTEAGDEMKRDFSKFKAVSYQIQGDGRSYLVKIETDDGFCWMMLHKPLHGNTRFVGVFNRDPNE